MSAFRVLVGRISVEAWAISLLGTVGLLILGRSLLGIISSQNTLLPTYLLVFMCITAILSLNHTLFVLILLADNSVPFMWASLLSGVAITVLSASCLSLHFGGILVVFIIEMGVHLSYNNWKWPHEAFKKYHLNISSLMRDGLNI
jgi:4-amino-4-deoxy-L-arabinose transferase-like glycosyltransferase